MNDNKIRQWRINATEAFANIDSNSLKNSYLAFEAVLDYIWRNGRPGSCHDSSAILYVLLSELNYSPTLMIGEVMAHLPFDHSWVEIDGKVIDPAVSYPLPEYMGGEHVGGPVFLNVDLDTRDVSELKYGSRSLNGLDDDANLISTKNLEEYSDYIEVKDNSESIWSMAQSIGETIGLQLSPEFLQHKYGLVTRRFINGT